MPILAKKSSFQMKLILILAGKQAKLSHLGHRKPARIHCKADVSKTVRILVKRIIGPFLFKNKKGEALMVIVIGICCTNFCSQKFKRRILATVGFNRNYVPHSRSYTRCFAPCFLRSHDQPQS